MFGLLKKIDRLLLEISDLREKLSESEEAGQAHYEECQKLRKDNEALKLEVRIARMYANDDKAVDELLTAHKRKQVELNTHEEHYLKSRNDYLERKLSKLERQGAAAIDEWQRHQLGASVMAQQAAHKASIQAQYSRAMGIQSAWHTVNPHDLVGVRS